MGLPPQGGLRNLLALGAGVLLPLGFAPFYLFPLAFVALVILFALWAPARPLRAALDGLLFGLGMFGLGVTWVYVSMHDFGNMSVPLAGFAVFLFIVLLALYPALLGALQASLSRVHGLWRYAFLLPALWVLFEWIRSWLLSGFPWLSLGYSQIDTPLAGLTAWSGVYGVSLATAVSAGLLVLALRGGRARAVSSVVVLLTIWVAAGLLGRVAFVEPLGTPIQAALVQGNIPLQRKWSPADRQAILSQYRRMTADARGADLVVWPEGAVPAFLQQLSPDYLQALREDARARRVGLVFGVLERADDTSATDVYYNSAVLLGRELHVYRKQHLVPFGEYLPFRWLLGWFIDNFQIPMSNFSPWPQEQGAVPLSGHALGVSICYEDAFPEEIARALPAASFLVNVSEDAWFGNSIGPHQRLQMARLRAIETGRPMLRASNTGISAVIDHAGEIVAQAPQFQQTSLRATIQPMQGTTPYVRFGNRTVLGLIFVMLAAALVATYRRAGRRS